MSESETVAARPHDGSAEAIHSARLTALDELARGAHRSSPSPAARRLTRDGARLADWAPPGSPRRRALSAAVAVVLLLVAVPAWQVVRRPAAAEDTLPRVASTTPVPDASTDLGGGAPVSDPAKANATAAAAPASSSLVVHVVGAVVRPGIVRLESGARVVDAVDAAGGLAPGADVDRVNLAAVLADGQRVVIPLVGQVPPVEVGPSNGAAAGSSSSGGDQPSPIAPVDLNTATAEQLDTLPGVGPATAAAIIAHRGESGPFASVDELLDVRGIGEARLESLRDLVTVGP